MTKRHTKLSILLCFLLFLFRVAPCIAQAGPGSAWCVVGGCNGELCTEQNRTVRTPCRYSPTFACYRNARCERQANGQCSWTITPQLRQCLNQNSSALEGIPDTSPAPSPAISLGAAYEVKCKDNLEHNMFTAVIEFTSPGQAHWKYTNASSWNEWLVVNTLSPHKILLHSNKNDPTQATWDLDFSPAFDAVTGTYRFLQNTPPPTRWRNYSVSGSKLN
jgi:hypothetical protein